MDVWTSAPLILSLSTAADRDQLHATGVFPGGEDSWDRKQEAGRSAEPLWRFREGKPLSTVLGIELSVARLSTEYPRQGRQNEIK